jgi:hypothetical protein
MSLRDGRKWKLNHARLNGWPKFGRAARAEDEPLYSFAKIFNL